MTDLKRRLLILSFGCTLLWCAILVSFLFSQISRKNTIVIGGKSDIEQLIVGEMIAQLIENETSLKVKRMFQLDGTLICFEAMLSGDVDLYCEYTGTALIYILKQPHVGQSKEGIYAQVKEEFDKQYDIEWFPPLGFDNRYVIVMDEKKAEKNNIKTVSDFREFQVKNAGVRLTFDSEFSCSPELTLLKSVYGIETKKSPLMQKTLACLSLFEGGVEAMVGYQTDALLSRFPLRVLDDDKDVLPPYAVAPIVRRDVLEKHPEVREIINRLAGRISNIKMQRLNYAVEAERKEVKEVARSFLKAEKLL